MRQMEPRKTLAGLLVCGAIFAWLAASDLRRNNDELESSVADVEYTAIQLQSDISSLQQDVGENSDSYGGSQAQRIDEAERRASDAESAAEETQIELRRLEREVDYLKIGRGY